jgi:hypothetical protein
VTWATARARGARLTAALLLSGAVVAGGLPASGAEDADATAVLEKLHAYLDDYEPKLGELVADEDFRQELRAGRSAVPAAGTRGGLLTRRLQSDFGFLRLPGDDAWLGHRSVHLLDGAPVLEEGRRLERLLAATAAGDLAGLARSIADENARHNLGHARSMNVPTLALELLGRRHAAAFTLVSQRPERLAGRRTRRLFMRERHPGRLVEFDATRANRADVVVWVDGTGAILRADVTLFPPRMRGQHTVRVDFAPSTQFGILVPVRLEERFNGKARGRGVATYSNYRRFQTAGRLVPDPAGAAGVGR